MSNTSIVICGEKFNIGTRVILWDEPGGLNGYDTSAYTHTEEDRKTGKSIKVTVSGKRYSSRSLLHPNPTLPQLKNLVTQFFLHHSGLYHSQTTYEVLHKQRRLSVHFILDDNGVLYQTLDLKEKAWHGGGNNPMSVGIEIDSRASAQRFPDAYDAYHQKKYKVGPRKVRQDNVQGMKINGFDYSDAQYKTLIKLGMVMVRIFPHIAANPDFPRTAAGAVIKSVLASPQKHKGFICHYNTTKSKWDPVCFDHRRFLNGIKHMNPDAPSTATWDSWSERQSVLNILGYNPGPIDGKFGPQTEKAIKEFQADHGLVADGIWGKNTEAAIDIALTAKGM